MSNAQMEVKRALMRCFETAKQAANVLHGARDASVVVPPK